MGNCWDNIGANSKQDRDMNNLVVTSPRLNTVSSPKSKVDASMVSNKEESLKRLIEINSRNVSNSMNNLTTADDEATINEDQMESSLNLIKSLNIVQPGYNTSIFEEPIREAKIIEEEDTQFLNNSMVCQLLTNYSDKPL